MYRNFGKRILDMGIALVGLIVLAIPMVLIAVIIKIDSPGPALFKQERIGREGKVYWMYKFRTMKVGAEHTGTGVYSGKGDTRVTKVGRFLRASSLDELPQFFNILSGDMSLIGFRSPLTYHPWAWEEYTDEQKKMFSVRPGITGWAQVNGRRTVEWNRRIEMNVWYAQNVSFALDVKIFFMTIFKVLRNQDNLNTEATAKVNKKEMVNK